jgi:hypothetical protein
MVKKRVSAIARVVGPANASDKACEWANGDRTSLNRIYKEGNDEIFQSSTHCILRRASKRDVRADR